MVSQPKTINSRRCPRRLHQFFWDVDPVQVDLTQQADYIIARLLEQGDLAAIHWMLATYGEQHIKDVLRRSRQLSRKTANLWRLRLAIPKPEIYALNRPFLLPPEPFY